MELMLQESGWEELRKEARKIEGDLDVKLSSYAKLGSRFTHPGTILFSLYIHVFDCQIYAYAIHLQISIISKYRDLCYIRRIVDPKLRAAI